MAQRTVVVPEGVAPPIGGYSHAIVATGGKLLFMAGQVAVDRQGLVVGAGDAGAQTRQIFANIEAVLKAAGATFGDVVEFTSYVVGREAVAAYREARQEIYARAYPKGGFPANTLLVVAGLARPEFLVEVKAVAVLP